MKTREEKAEEMLQRLEVVVVASVSETGCPRPVPMSKIKSEGYFVVWMVPGSNSLKINDFIRSSKAGLCFFENGNSVIMTGEVEVISDEAVKKAM